MKKLFALFFSCNLLFGMSSNTNENKFSIDSRLLAVVKSVKAPFDKVLIRSIVKEFEENNKKETTVFLQKRLREKNDYKQALQNWLAFYASKTTTPFGHFDPITQVNITSKAINDEKYVWLTQKELVDYILQYFNYRIAKSSFSYVLDYKFNLFLNNKEIKDQAGLLKEYAFNLLFINKAFQDKKFAIVQNGSNRIIVKENSPVLTQKLFYCSFPLERPDVEI